jgi:enoyl-CoA hydratase/carnithine racemase
MTRSAAQLLHRLRDRVVCEVHGACIGAGIELPAFAGRIVAAPDSHFVLPEVGMGLVPGAGGTVSITKRIGRLRTAAMALSGQRVDAPTALAWGLVDAIA